MSGVSPILGSAVVVGSVLLGAFIGVGARSEPQHAPAPNSPVDAARAAAVHHARRLAPDFGFGVAEPDPGEIALVVDTIEARLDDVTSLAASVEELRGAVECAEAEHGRPVDGRDLDVAVVTSRLADDGIALGRAYLRSHVDAVRKDGRWMLARQKQRPREAAAALADALRDATDAELPDTVKAIERLARGLNAEGREVARRVGLGNQVAIALARLSDKRSRSRAVDVLDRLESPLAVPHLLERFEAGSALSTRRARAAKSLARHGRRGELYEVEQTARRALFDGSAKDAKRAVNVLVAVGSDAAWRALEERAETAQGSLAKLLRKRLAKRKR